MSNNQSNNKKEFKTRSGEVLRIRAVGQANLAQFINQIQALAPKPPMEVVQTADGPKEIANESHPDYQAALQAYGLKQGTFLLALYIQLGVVLTLNEEQSEEARDLQATLEEVNPGAAENKFLKYLYLTSVCTELEELQALMAAIQAINTPTGEQVQAHLDAFRSGVQGATLNENKNAPERDRVPDWEPSLHALQSGPVGGDGFETFLREARPGVAS